MAWVLVGESFPGKRLVSWLIHLSALPTVVAGLTLIALDGPDSLVGHLAHTRGAVIVALLFVQHCRSWLGRSSRC